MTRVGLRPFVVLAILLAIGGCEGAEVVVFSAPQSGSAGVVASAGLAGLVGGAGAGLAGGAGASLGGSPNAAGSGGNATPAGSGGGGDKPCRDLTDCFPSYFCRKQNCSDAAGFCVPSPIPDDPVLAPVCGCDHLTYWNDTLRQAFGVSATLTTGACGSDARTCDGDNPCPPGASCSRRLRDISACMMPGPGQCWVTPTDCSATNEKPRFLPCPPPGTPPGSPLPPCLTTCDAVQSGQAYFQPKNVCQ